LTYQPPFDPQQPQSAPPAYGPPPQYQPQPAQPYGAPQPGYPMQQQPPKRRKKWPWIVGGIVLAGILGCVGLFTLVLGGTAKVAADLDDNQSGKNAVAGKMNTPVTDGKFQFTVTGMKCGLDKVGDDVVSQKAQGQFCLVDVQVKNVGKTQEYFVDSTQKAFDAAGTEYSVDSGAAVYANKDYDTFLAQINPGNTVKGKLVFDVPAKAKLTSVTLHESTFTAGVKIPLK
jgi:hypothetical protein